MNPALTSGVSTGATLALAWKLLQDFQPPVAVSCPSPLLEQPFIDWRSALLGLVVGLLLGFLIGPLLAALISFRLWLFHQALERLAAASRQPTRPSFRIC